ncbi:MAG TPA: hypothetical protein VLD86_05890, partial [Ilumatobacteraceae bacterium]|nr:hypothetical protein [Ilumatobacteraceae bacterium]
MVDIAGTVLRIRNKDFSQIKEAFKKPDPGAQAEKGGVGGAIFLQFLNNTTHAIVESGVDLYSGGDSGLNVKAEEAILDLGFSQAGADSGKWAVAGTFSIFNQDSDILAQVAEGARIDGGRVDVYAGSLETQISWAGGVAKGKSVGAGVAVAVNNTERKTRAIIGEAADTAGTGSNGRIHLGTSDDPADGFPDPRPISGSVTSRATVSGGVYTFAVAGAVVSTTPDKSATQNQKALQSNSGIAIAGAAAVNVITDTTQASLADADVDAAAVDTRATNANHIVAASGGLAFANASAGAGSSSSQTAAAVAGALGINEINATTDAFVRDSVITVEGVPLDNLVVETAKRRFSVTADDVGSIWTLSAGIGGALADGGASAGGTAVALTGSLSINTVTGRARARMIDSQLDLKTTEADYLSTDFVPAVTSGQTVRIANGPDAGDVYEYVGTGGWRAADHTTADGAAQVLPGQRVLRVATDHDDEGVFKYIGTTTLSSTNLAEEDFDDATKWEAVSALSAMAAAFKTSADWRLSQSNALIRATDDAEIFAIAGSLSIGIAKGGGSSSATAASVGVAIAVNTITSDTEALVQSTEITWEDEARGGLTIDAVSTGSIKAFTVAGAIAAGLATQGAGTAAAGAGSGSVNEIDADTTATLRQSTVDAGDGVTVKASNDSEIIAGAGAVAVAFAAAGKSTAAAGAFGAAFAINTLGGEGDDNRVWAEIDASDVTAGAAITVEAQMLAGIFSIGIGAAGGSANSGTGSAIGVAGAGSVGLNKIRNSTQARVRNGSTLTTEADSGAGISVIAADHSWINSTAGAAALSISIAQSTAIAASLGFSLTINDIEKTTRA